MQIARLQIIAERRRELQEVARPQNYCREERATGGSHREDFSILLGVLAMVNTQLQL